MKTTGTVRFIVREDKKTRCGKCPVDVLYSVNGKRSCLRTDLKILPNLSENNAEDLVELTELKNWAINSIKTLEQWHLSNKQIISSKDIIEKLKRFKKEPKGVVKKHTTIIQSICPNDIRGIYGLKEIPLSIIDIVGVYFLCRDKEVVYVGESNAVVRRVVEHKRKGEYEFDSIFYYPCSINELEEIETFYINKFNPIYNKQKKTKIA